jgi:hypothetical protein
MKPTSQNIASPSNDTDIADQLNQLKIDPKFHHELSAIGSLLLTWFERG